MNDEYLINEKPMKALIVFSMPMIIGSLFQQVYNMADSIIVGNYVGQNALAAVGASAALTMVFICIALGAGVGASILVSRYFGAREYDRMKQSVSTSMIFFLFLSIGLGLLGYFTSGLIMKALNTPDSVIDMAVIYLQVYFVGFPFLFMYNILSNMFNAIGKSRIPLYFLIFSSILNILLDIYMVASLGMGVFGAAFATLIAQGISAVASFVVFVKEMKHYEAKEYDRFNISDMNQMLRLALPSIIQQSTVSIGMMLVQSVVNSFGAEALAGFSAGARIENIMAVPFVSISNALSSYTSQNYGAKKMNRIKEGFHAGLLMDVFFAVLLFVSVKLLNKPMIAMFLGDEGTQLALKTGMNYIGFISMFTIFIGIKMATDGVLRGLGLMKVFMFANIVNLGIRVSVAMLMAPRFGIDFVWMAVPLGWAANFVISYIEYRRKKSSFGIE